LYLNKLIFSKSGFLDYCFFAHLHGFGEPLLNKNIIKFIQLLGLKACNTDFFTNGMLLRENVAKKLVDYSVEKVNVSFYGGTKESYERIMRNCDFDVVLNNLKYLNAYKKKTDSEYPKVGFTLAVMQSNFKELSRIAQLAALVGATTLRLDHFLVYEILPQLNKEYKKYHPIKDFLVISKLMYVCSKNNIELLLADYLSTSKVKDVSVWRSGADKLRKCINKPIFGIFKNDNLPYAEGYIDLNKQKENYYKNISKIYSKQYSIYCFQPFTTMFVKQDGKVKPCCFWRDDYLEFELGDINTQRIEDIWNGEKFQALREDIIKGLVPYSCYDCLTSGSMPKTIGYPNVIGMEKITKSKFLEATQNRFEVICEVSKDNMENVRFISLSVERIEGENIILTSTNNDPQIIFDIRNIIKDIFIFIKIIITKLRDTNSLEVFYSYNNKDFTEQNKIYLPLKEGENFLWCFIPNEKDIPITGIRIDPVSEQTRFNIQFIFICKLNYIGCSP
jgi:radical SAM protein with 4Fe4S-binding SPASM domain